MSAASRAPDLRDVSAAPPVVEVRKARISADLEWHRLAHWAVPQTMLTQYLVIVDGRRVDSFLTKENAERRAAQLRGK